MMVINCAVIPETSEYDSWDIIDSHSHTASENEISDYRKGFDSSAGSYADFLLQHFFPDFAKSIVRITKWFRLEGTSGVVLCIPLWSSRANWLTCIHQKAYEYQTRKSSPLLQLTSFLISLTKKGDRQCQYSSWLASLQAARGGLPTQHTQSQIIKPHTAWIMTSASFIFMVLKQILLFSSILPLTVFIPVRHLYCYP